ncbi:hypothetical protein HRbin21_00749 [bacterium HR21]|nr:hypothetical protein HRbin21_00749 [bacterium HR21]
MKEPEQRHPNLLPGRRWRQLAPYANLGMTIAVALLGCGALGWWFDHMVHSSPFGLLVGLFLGCAVALWEIWKVVRRLNRMEGNHQ